MKPKMIRQQSRFVIPEGFFEGPEKLLEVWFKPSPSEMNISIDYEIRGLRIIERKDWEDMLSLVKCTIVSSMSNSEVDAYMLSESSMFVYPHKILLKTCGSTTLLHALPRLLQLARDCCDMNEVEYLFYSRKNYLEPTRQQFPHNCFEDEFNVLEELFPEGRAYTLGQVNGDHWNIFILENETASEPETVDQTLEILMHDLEPSAAKAFYRDDEFVSSRQTTIRTKIHELLPGAQMDDLVFNPCGYSINAILDGYYFTIHVTPQQEFSYASFETNAPIKIDETIKKVLSIFQPGRFTVTHLTNTPNAKNNQPLRTLERSKNLGHYKRTTTSTYEFHHYHLTYTHFQDEKTQNDFIEAKEKAKIQKRMK